MGNHDSTLAKIHKTWQDLCNILRINDILITDAGQFGNTERNWFFRIDKLGKTFRDLPANDLDRSDLYDVIIFCMKSCRLQVKDHIGIIQTLVLGIRHNTFGIIHQIDLTAIDHLEVRIQIMHGMVCIRESLYGSMVGNCDRLMSPTGCPLDDILDIRYPIHITHLGMAV